MTKTKATPPNAVSQTTSITLRIPTKTVTQMRLLAASRTQSLNGLANSLLHAAVISPDAKASINRALNG
jgi:predicted HicB family RNase H-like nuclease